METFRRTLPYIASPSRRADISDIAKSDSVETILDSFVVWLANHHSSATVGRVCCTVEVDQLLRWQQRQHASGDDCATDAYIRELCGRGAPEKRVAVAAESIRVFRRYLRSTD